MYKNPRLTGLRLRFELKHDLKGCKEHKFGFGCQFSVVLEVFTWLACTGARPHHDKQMNTNVHVLRYNALSKAMTIPTY